MVLPITYEEPSGNGFFQWPLTLTSTQSLCLPGSPFTLSLSLGCAAPHTGSQFLDQGSNSRPLQGKPGVNHRTIRGVPLLSLSTRRGPYACPHAGMMNSEAGPNRRQCICVP